MKLSEAISNWKSNITTHMAVEYVLTLRANINAFSDAAQSLEDDNVKLRELVRDMWNGMCGYGHDCRFCEHYELYEGQRFVGECEYHRRLRELGIEVD